MISGKANTPLRFGALIRVSTEGQDKNKKSSLPVQRQKIEQAVQTLGGTIQGWYGGVEHGTPGYEKKEIDRLLSDASKKRFDAVICSDPDRWSRDNAKSESGLDILRDHGIRFFVGDDEHDLFDVNDSLFLGISAVIGQYFAANQKKKSLEGRIYNAKQGYSSCGKRPFGRTWDKKSKQWGIDKTKKALIEEAARRYLAGESMQTLADEIAMNHASLHKTLMERCGDEWVQTFRQKNKPPEVVVTKIPRLLPEETIKTIRQKAQANKTYAHGQSKHPYLLSRMIFCESCGYAMFGQTNHRNQERRYYRHAHNRRVKECRQPKGWIPADEIEELAVLHLFQTFGNPQAVERAVQRASGDMEKVREYQARVERLGSELAKVKTGRQKILDWVLTGKIPDAEAEAKLDEAKGREAKLIEERNHLTDYLGNRPSPEQIEDVSKRVAAQFRKFSARISTARRLASRLPLSRMSWEDQRALLERVFSGTTPEGRRMGVYIAWNDKGTDWTFSLRGHLIQEENLIRWAELTKDIRRETAEEGAGTTLPTQKELANKVSQSACDCTARNPP